MTECEEKQLPPLVSVVMPVYNAGSFLRPAVDSIRSQTHQQWELVLVDDGSSDGCLDSLADIGDERIRIFRLAHGGKPRALNHALSAIRGSFYALQDADDLSEPHRLERQLAYLLQHPELAGVFCGHSLLLDGKPVARRLRAKGRDECARDIAAGAMPAHDPTAMYRLSVVGHLRYADDLPIVEGLDYILRVGEEAPLAVLGECLYQYRIHPQSVTRRLPTERDRLRREALARMAERRGRPVIPSSSKLHGHAEADNDVVSHFSASVADLVLAGARREALATGWECMLLHPLTLYYMKPLVYACCPARVVWQHRERRARRDVDRVRQEQALRTSGSRDTASPA